MADVAVVLEEVGRAGVVIPALETLGFGPVGSTPAAFQALIDSDVSTYAAIARKANITLDR